MSSAVVAGFDPVSGVFSLSWWLAAVLAAFLVACFALAVTRAGLGVVLAAGGGISLIVFILSTVWGWSNRSSDSDRAVRRDALSARSLELASRAIAAGSALACLDGTAGELVELSCEKALFVSPEAVASATSYVAARISLLISGADPIRSTRASGETPLPGLRASLEEDRFGFAAQVLMTSYGCTAEKCDTLGVFGDATRLRANLRERPYDTIVARNAPAWVTRPAAPAVAAVPAPNRTGPSLVPPGFNVPSSASIPPVSIMTPEGPPPPPQSPPAARSAPPRPASNAPVQISPPAATAGNAPPRAQ